MKTSIVTPVFNEEKSINTYCNAIFHINYDKNNFEIVIVDDGSSDNTVHLIRKLWKNSKIKSKIIQLGKNFGRSVARVTGARAAKYDNILFLDAKCEIFPDALRMIEKINYSPINPAVIQKRRGPFDIFFYMLRRTLYKKNFGEKFSQQFITPENFDSMAKGTTMFFCTKDLFLSSQPANISSKNNSDDTALLANMVKKKAILTTPRVRCYYNTRSSFIENIKHIFNRGPKFVDYYYKPSKKHFWLMNLALMFIFLLTYRIYSGTISFYDALLTLLILDLLLTFFISKSAKEFLTFLFLFPLFSAIFTTGLIKGIFLKSIGRF